MMTSFPTSLGYSADDPHGGRQHEIKSFQFQRQLENERHTPFVWGVSEIAIAGCR